MKTKTLLTQILIAVLFLSTIQVQAQRRNFDGPRNSDTECQGQDCRIPDLSDEQEAQITELRNAHYAEVKDLRADLAILRAEKHKLMIADSPNTKAIDAKIDEMSVVQTQMQKKRVAHHFATRNLLTAEQKVYFDMHRSKNNKHGVHNGHKKDHGSRGMSGSGMHDGSCRD